MQVTYFMRRIWGCTQPALRIRIPPYIHPRQARVLHPVREFSDAQEADVTPSFDSISLERDSEHRCGQRTERYETRDERAKGGVGGENRWDGRRGLLARMMDVWGQ
jgi:hypothetical protein